MDIVTEVVASLMNGKMRVKVKLKLGLFEAEDGNLMPEG